MKLTPSELSLYSQQTADRMNGQVVYFCEKEVSIKEACPHFKFKKITKGAKHLIHMFKILEAPFEYLTNKELKVLFKHSKGKHLFKKEFEVLKNVQKRYYF